ncbi:MAG: hypothetical protein Q9191_002633, partial [Dirinaria sp. TL-2023a]
LASPLDSLRIHTELRRRDNNWNLKCPNAPNVTAGQMVNASDVVATDPNNRPASGSNEAWMEYLWCTPGTETYTFFSNGRLIPPPITYHNVLGALNGGLADVQSTIAAHGDGPIQSRPEDAMMGTYGVWYINPPGTQMMVQAESANMERLTYGILGAALTGLIQYVEAGYDNSNNPLVFQINDGRWGEVGTGFVGYIDPVTHNCMIQSLSGEETECSDVGSGKIIH